MLKTISPETVLLLYLTGTTALGCNERLNSINPFLINNKCLTTFTPPEVLPAEPPRNISPKKNTNKNGVHDVKSAVTKPVVVTMEITWNKPCLNDDSISPKIIGCEKTNEVEIDELKQINITAIAVKIKMNLT